MKGFREIRHWRPERDILKSRYDSHLVARSLLIKLSLKRNTPVTPIHSELLNLTIVESNNESELISIGP